MEARYPDTTGRGIAATSPPADAIAWIIAPYTSSSVTPGTIASRAAAMPTSAMRCASRTTSSSARLFQRRTPRATDVASYLIVDTTAARTGARFAMRRPG